MYSQLNLLCKKMVVTISILTARRISCITFCHKVYQFSRFCYVGSSDGYIEVFKSKQYSGSLERFKTDHPFGVDCVVLLRPELLVTASNEDDEIRLLFSVT